MIFGSLHLWDVNFHAGTFAHYQTFRSCFQSEFAAGTKDKIHLNSSADHSIVEAVLVSTESSFNIPVVENFPIQSGP